jgi:hypothetical protein
LVGEGGIALRFKAQSGRSERQFVPATKFPVAVEFLTRHAAQRVEVAFLTRTRVIVDLRAGPERTRLAATG